MIPLPSSCFKCPCARYLSDLLMQEMHGFVFGMLHSVLCINNVQKAEFLCNTQNSSRDGKCKDQLTLSDSGNNATFNFPWESIRINFGLSTILLPPSTHGWITDCGCRLVNNAPVFELQRTSCVSCYCNAIMK